MMNNLSSQIGELKSQGAEDAARDPNSTVTAQDAQRTIVDETKKAGGAAFRFNPDASPEEKAAVAAAVSQQLPRQNHQDSYRPLECP